MDHSVAGIPQTLQSEKTLQELQSTSKVNNRKLCLPFFFKSTLRNNTLQENMTNHFTCFKMDVMNGLISSDRCHSPLCD